jgi:hypothetical protein
MAALIFRYQLGSIKGEDVIFILFEYDVQLIDEANDLSLANKSPRLKFLKVAKYLKF